MEVWKSLKDLGFSKYEASTFGNFKTVKTGRIWPGNEHGVYYRITISDDKNKSNQIMTHTLLALLFIGPRPSPQHTVDHIDGNPRNNRIENLRWATKSEQRVNQRGRETHKSSRPITQMSEDGKFEIFTWFKAKDAAKHFNILASNFAIACRSEIKLGGYRWKYCVNNIEGEEWKDIISDSFEPLRVSNKGRYYKINSGKIGFGSKTYAGYRQVSLVFKDGERKTVFVHRLITLAFLGDSDLQVNHIDGNKSNNKIENLEYVTASENGIHSATYIKDYSSHKKALRPVEQYTLEGKFVNSFSSATEASEITKISKCNICTVCNGKRPHAGGYFWKYK